MNKYKCTKCGIDFEIEHEVEKDGALCNKCFKKLVDGTHTNNTNYNLQFYKKFTGR